MEREQVGSRQEFYGDIDQVAGGDIINIYVNDYWSWDTSALKAELSLCYKKKASAQRAILTSPSFLAFLVWAITVVTMLFTKVLFALPPEAMLGVILVGFLMSVGLPNAGKKYGRVVSLQRHRIEAIELILADREFE